MSHTARPRLLGTVIAACLAFSLVGCAAETTYHPDAAERMQGRVHAASVAAQAGDHAAVLDSLATLEVELHDALAREQVTQARFDAVTAAIALVRTDVEAAIAAATPPPAPEAPATEPVAPEEQPKGPDQKGPDQKGPGKDKGKKGKGQG